jgi:hypothetical protein
MLVASGCERLPNRCNHRDYKCNFPSIRITEDPLIQTPSDTTNHRQLIAPEFMFGKHVEYVIVELFHQ